MITKTMDKVEAIVGHSLVKRGKSRRRPILTHLGVRFRQSVAHVLDAWDKVVFEIAAAVEMERDSGATSARPPSSNL